ncbi:MAG: VWA domain-containing protein [Prosthecobacter sp.]|uniref:vWA domain-containing protein n=1 Tax=Prosthecobacter sp. TaxID=1965333 RepID=UPI0025D0C7DE|nr:VWA domain-containing protein [Prosthecobacter sp.]MCF7785240.1 VWA domain-containing protein [Prosthecobacter sp.]
MNFAQPLWLLAGVAACAALVWQYRRFDLAQRAALAQFAAERLLHKLTTSVSASRRRTKRVLFTLGVGLLFVALARPQAGFEWQETHRKGLELLFAVDTSKSMLAQDMKPDRLTRAKLGVKDLVTKLKGDGVGLVAFAGNAFLQCPVTLDYDAFRESLDALDTTTIPHGGSDMAAAIRESEAVFKTRTTAEKILVLITDGEDLGGEGITAAEAAAKKGIKIFTVGVGGANGELVPVPNENGGTDFARDENGQFVKSHLDEETLKKIAEVTGGMYQPLGTQGEGLTKIYEEGLASFTREELSARQAKVPLEKFYWPLLAALLCLVGEMLIGNRRTVRKPVPEKKKLAPGLRPATAALALFAGVMNANAASPQSAEQAYQKGDFAKAQQEYAENAAKQPASAELHYNAGSAAYKAGDYAQAATGFQQSLNTDQVALQHDAYYNLGNTQYRLGQKTGKEKPQETIKTWEEAVKSYDAALQIDANDTEAKHNRDLVQKKIDELKKQEEQKKQEQQKQDQKDQQQNQDQSQDQKNDSKDSQKDSQDQKNDTKDQNSDSKDSKGGDKGEPQKDSKDQKDNAKDNQSAAKDQKNESQESKADEQKKPDESKGEQADTKKDEPKDQKAGTQPQSGDEKKDQQQADAKSGKDEQPKPVDAGQKPSQGDIQAANGEQPQDDQAAEAAAEDQQREPGQMTKEEARHLLDALKGDERQVPSISARGRAASQPNDHKKLKDW